MRTKMGGGGGTTTQQWLTTTQQWLATTQLRQEVSFLAFTVVSGSSSAEEGCTDAYWKTLNPFVLEKGVTSGWLILIPNYSLLYLHSNKQFEKFTLGGGEL